MYERFVQEMLIACNECTKHTNWQPQNPIGVQKHLQMEHIRKVEYELCKAAVLDGQGAQMGKLLQFAERVENLLGPAAQQHLLRRKEFSQLGAVRMS